MESDKQRLRAALEAISNDDFKAYMLRAMERYDESVEGASDESGQTDDDKADPTYKYLKDKSATVSKARNALFLVAHALAQEAGFKTLTNAGAALNDLLLPENWENGSDNGLFGTKYSHPNDVRITYELQGLFVGNKFEVYLSDDKDHTYSIELSVDKYIGKTSGDGRVSAAETLRALPSLRSTLQPFMDKVVPRMTAAASTGATVGASSTLTPTFSDTDIPAVQIPPVGRGDTVPAPLNGREDPSMLVGPDHPMFGRGGDPSRGPVPGARFDPYGPPRDPLIDPSAPGRFRPPPGRGGMPGPNAPFGEPNPDHLRMPMDDQEDNPLRMPGRGRRGGDMDRPFGSDHMFF